MKEPGAIRHRLRSAVFRHSKKRLERELRTAPFNCRHNATVELPQALGGRPIGMCQYPANNGQFKPGVCDADHDGIHQAERCPYFALCHTKEELKAGFKDFLARASYAEIKRVYPDVATFLWVLDGEEPIRGDVFDEDDEITEDEPILVDINGTSVRVYDEAAREALGVFLDSLKIEPPEPPEAVRPEIVHEPPAEPPAGGSLWSTVLAVLAWWRGRGQT